MTLTFSTAQALILESGQVIVGDGGVKDGASPKKQRALFAQAQNGGDVTCLIGSSVFVVVGNTIITKSS